MPLLTDNKSKALAPFESAFIADPVFKSASVDKFYSNLDKLNKLSADTNRNYGIDSKLVTPYEEERNKLNKLAKQLSDLRKQQTEAQKEKDEEKVVFFLDSCNCLLKKSPDTTEVWQKFANFVNC